MIHVADDLFHAAGFLEAFRIHTSTSPNYQIIASLDIGRRQAALEGFHRVREALRLSLQLRRRIKDSVDLQPYFNVLGDEEMVPQCYRSADAANSPMALANLSAVWGESDFVIDPTRVTLDLRNTGMDGSSFRQLLMTRYDIQVNKTSRHTVLFLINIGATQASIDYLVQVLLEMAAKFKYERRNRHWESASAEATVVLPSKRRFHSAFTPFEGGEFCAGDIRAAYFDGLTEGHAAYVSLSNDTLARVSAGQQWVSASFVTPYPPGFPVLVPGQIITTEILHYFQNCKVREIHGFHPELGFKVFTDTYLAKSAITYPEIETY
jgi:arginine decarboxylase